MLRLPIFLLIFFAFIEHIKSSAANIHNLWATVSVLFLDGALSAVEGIGCAGAIAYNTAALLGTKIALVADMYWSRGSHIGITENTLAITPFTKPSHCYTNHVSISSSSGCCTYTGLFSAHDKIGVMLSGHLG